MLECISNDIIFMLMCNIKSLHNLYTMTDIICYVDENNKLLTDTNDIICTIRESFYELKSIFEQDIIDTETLNALLTKTYVTNAYNKVPIIKSSLGNTLYYAVYRLPDATLVKLPLCCVDNIKVCDDLVIGERNISLADKDKIIIIIKNNIYMIENAIKILHNLSVIY